MNDILNRINELRARKGWSQYELAKQAGLAPNTVYSWSRVGVIPSLSNIERICAAANITVEQFFCDTGTVSEEEKHLLADWAVLSDIEKRAIYDAIAAFRALRK